MVVHPRSKYAFWDSLTAFDSDSAQNLLKPLLLGGCNLFCHFLKHQGSMIIHSTEDNHNPVNHRLLVKSQAQQSFLSLMSTSSVLSINWKIITQNFFFWDSVGFYFNFWKQSLQVFLPSERLTQDVNIFWNALNLQT